MKRLVMLLLVLHLAACTGGNPPTMDATRQFDAALLTATYAVRLPTDTPTLGVTTTITPTDTPVPPLPTPTLPRTPPALPATFTSSWLNVLDEPHAYIEDTCQYLKMRWNPNNAAPGTVVMVVMFHSITGDENALANDFAIHHSDMINILTHAEEVGFETITTPQLVDFLYNNAKIPRRSIMLIQDDRPPGAYRLAFGPYLDEYGWTMTWAWPIGDTDTRPASNVLGETYTSLWQQMETYFATGKLDIQSHGYVHNTPISADVTDEYIRHEMIDSREVLRAHFYCKDQNSGQTITNCASDQPQAYIWAGGGFSKRGVQIGREAGYKVGFTTLPRGPVMFNWIPQADQLDPARPYWTPEGPAGDPLMTLPRYWSTDAAFRIDEVSNIGEEAEKYAAQKKATELEYYDIICKPVTGEIPGLKP
jgi:hypothetical protein